MKNNRIHHIIEHISTATVEQSLLMFPLNVSET